MASGGDDAMSAEDCRPHGLARHLDLRRLLAGAERDDVRSQHCRDDDRKPLHEFTSAEFSERPHNDGLRLIVYKMTQES